MGTLTVNGVLIVGFSHVRPDRFSPQLTENPSSVQEPTVLLISA